MNTTELQRCIVSQNSQHHNFTHRFCTHFVLFWSYNIIFIVLHEKTFQKMYGLLFTYPYSFRVIKLQSSLAGIVAFFPKPVRCKRVNFSFLWSSALLSSLALIFLLLSFSVQFLFREVLLPHCRFKGYNAIKYLKIPKYLLSANPLVSPSGCL